MKKNIILITVLFIIITCCSSAADDDFAAAISKIEEQYFKYSELGQIHKMPALFHYPEGISEKSRDEDAKEIIFFINQVEKELGHIKNHKLVTEQELSIGVSIGSATNDYWNDHKNFVRRIYKVKFDKIGIGYVLFDFCKISKKWEIGFVRYHLPISNDKAKQVFQKISEKFVNRIKEKTDSQSHI